MGIDRSDPNRAHVIVDPDGVGPRMFFLREPEGHWITVLDPEGNEFCLH